MKLLLRILLGLVALLVAAVIAVIVFYRVGAEHPQEQVAARTTPGSMTPAQEFAAVSANSEAMRALSDNYPDQAEQLRQQVLQMPAGSTSADMYALIGEFLRAFTASKRSALAAAPDRVLQEVIRADGEALRHLQREDASLCAQHVTAGLPPSAHLSQETVDVLSAAAAMRIRAARAGEATPVQRPHVSDADSAALATAMLNAGADPSDLGQGAAGLTDVEACWAVASLYQALPALPTDQAARIYSDMIRNAAPARVH